MQQQQLDPKEIIEGPPRRKHPVLLRQTSFKALDEQITFIRADGLETQGSHTARFGEIEQRGMALTPKGRKLYDHLLAETLAAVPDALSYVEDYYRQLQLSFERFPDDLIEIWRQGLGYFRFQMHSTPFDPLATDLDSLITQGHLELIPITYEDFLPVSAAGIFRSNLDPQQSQDFERSPNQLEFENALGYPLHNEFDYYATIQAESLERCLQQAEYEPRTIDSLLQQLSARNH
jgi:uncharacterized glyoxalase superfamily metalloenzyme YdcJ